MQFPTGDERVFYNDFTFLIDNDIFNSIINGVSIPYILLAKLVSSITKVEHMSLRISGSISTICLILYLFLKIKIDTFYKKSFLAYLLFIISSTGATIHGTNDSLFFLAFIIFSFEALKVFEKSNNLLLYLSSSIMIATRPVALIYLFIFIFSFFLNEFIKKLRNKKKSVNFEIVKPIGFGILVITILSIPRFYNNNFSFSFSDKSIDKRGLTWTEWVFYSQNIAYRDEKKNMFNDMVDFREVLEYKKSTDSFSLPKTPLEYLLFDPFILLKRIIFSFFEVMIISIRYTGILLIIFPMYVFKKFYRIKDFNRLGIISFILAGILTWIIIWPGLVQHRWLYPFYISIALIIWDIDEVFKNVFHKLSLYNLLLIDIIIIWSLWKENFFYNI